MSSTSDTDETGSIASDLRTEDETDETVIDSIFQPYQYEPLADVDESNGDGSGEEDDEDGIPFASLEARSENNIPVGSWCKCGHCNVEHIASVREFRCCHEVRPAIGLMVFDGSIERHRCVTQHDDFEALVNKTVLNLAGPLFRDRNGRTYRRNAGQSENE
ncbi:uncharacterized protein LOC110248089 [Exaiptasia diaphana]|uniref:Uncharacterized protein n=1 Tax=Exaiptasia diaphana TaxID=2652724 RepID=A0A913YT28_EXADI|nr:uncharacterized protein LOC110248089 [Exaiptasia diaphana]KXJ08929.1 hypothetical protein AC249_AIPGENE15246 [Exaiptasia diaphana]